jgi:hypothetical protein
MNRIKNRAKEPSTWAGLAVLLQAVAPLVPHWGGIIMAVSALAGAVAVKLPETSGYLDQ